MRIQLSRGSRYYLFSLLFHVLCCLVFLEHRGALERTWPLHHRCALRALPFHHVLTDRAHPTHSACPNRPFFVLVCLGDLALRGWGSPSGATRGRDQRSCRSTRLSPFESCVVRARAEWAGILYFVPLFKHKCLPSLSILHAALRRT